MPWCSHLLQLVCIVALLYYCKEVSTTCLSESSQIYERAKVREWGPDAPTEHIKSNIADANLVIVCVVR